jgi:TetR/AcrR family transcriptional repressor of nem operon
MSNATSPSKKERTHDRIVESAARAIRRQGFAGVSVAEIMKDAGLTHGGFYAHFPSREALLAEALDLGASQSVSLLESAEAETRGKGLRSFIDRYLSDAHAQQPETGCTLAALGCETARQSPELRAVATRRLKQTLALIEGQLSGTAAERRETAIGVMSTLVGALMLSRVVNEPDLARSFRSAGKRSLRDELA